MDTVTEHVNAALEKVAQQHGFQKYKLDIAPGVNIGDNFLGVVFKVLIKEDEVQSEKEPLKLFCKIPQETSTIRNDLNICDIFTREVFMLDVIIPRYKKLEEELGITNGFESYPKLFAFSSTYMKEYLVMNDLSEEGYEMLDIHKGINVEYMQLALEEMGKFHALGFVLKSKNSELYQKYQESMPEVLIKPKMDKGLRNYFGLILNGAVKKVKLEGKYEIAWKNFHENYYEHVADLSNGKLAEPYAIISHGDLWNNNMLFKCKNGVPVGVCFVDWQIARYASPVMDIVYYIFGNTTRSVRSLYYETLLNTYYNSVSTFLRTSGFEPDEIFPYSAFRDHLVKFGKFCLAFGIFIPIIYQNKDKPQDLDGFLKSDSAQNRGSDEIGNYDRLRDMVIDAVDLGYL